jgi:hypothetical protein
LFSTESGYIVFITFVLGVGCVLADQRVFSDAADAFVQGRPFPACHHVPFPTSSVQILAM